MSISTYVISITNLRKIEKSEKYLQIMHTNERDS